MSTNGQFPLQNILTASSADNLYRPFKAWPNLRRTKFLFPVQSNLFKAGLVLYTPQNWLGRIRKKLALVAILGGDVIQLHEANLVDLENTFAKTLLKEKVFLAFSTGTPGAYRKLTVQVMDHDGTVIAYAKAADQALAKQAVHRERANLELLASDAALDGQVPVLLGSFDWNEASFIIISTVQGKQGPRALQIAHIDYLCRLHWSFGRNMRFEASPMWMRLAHGLVSLTPHLSHIWQNRYKTAREVLVANLCPVDLPVSLAQRDFAPWNTRLGDNGVFVFDWEFAEVGMTPLYDAFHFLAIQAALDNVHFDWQQEIYSDMLARIWPRGIDSFPWLFLAYLVDMSLFYAEARIKAPDVGDERVFAWYGEQIDRFVEKL